jgi:hypothetical protein
MKIKIIQKGWEGYTGILGTVMFKDGVSTRDLTPNEQAYFSVVMRVAEIENDGTETHYSASAELTRTGKIQMPVVEKRKTVEQIEAEAPAPAADEVTAPDPMPVEQPTEKKVWTREELEEVADKDGIRGLRVIGTPMGAKNTSIHKLIDEILTFQAKA